VRTVEGVLTLAAVQALGHPVTLRGSGRTDSGVHAAGQVANLRTDVNMPAESIRKSINARLSDDVAILHTSDVAFAFDATQSAVSKLYRYRIHQHSQRPVRQHRRRFVYHCWRKLDVERMRSAARHFVGEHDFSSMTAAGCQRHNYVRTVLRCDAHRHLHEIRVDVRGTGFLYRQVRNMVGTLIEVGRGHWPPEAVADILASRDRSRAGPTAPAHGLCLQWVEYPPVLLSPDMAGTGAADTLDMPS